MDNIKMTPPLLVDELIKKFNTLLEVSGMSSVVASSLIKDGEETESIISQFTANIEKKALQSLSSNYDKVQDIIAEIIAELEDEPYFYDVELPDIPDVDHNNTVNLKSFIIYINEVKQVVQPLIEAEIASSKKKQFLSAIKNKKAIIDKGFFYEFTDGDLSRIQQLINELRDEITSSELFEENHKQRLLRRLELMQSEMHKKMSDVDKIWGLVGDAGIAIGKFGNDAKPFVDRIKELSQIAFRTQARAEELPSDSTNPLLGNDEE